jgi:hypothetical protein
MGLLPLAAALVSGAFSVSVIRQFLSRRGPHQLAWGIALATFAAASLFAAVGIMVGWSAPIYRAYYLFGAVVNVPILALGTIYLYFPGRVAHTAAVVVGVASVYAGVAVLGAPLDAAHLNFSGGIPAGSQVMDAGVRALSRYYSYAGFLIVVAGACWSAVRLGRRPGERFRRVAQGNALIAAGTVVVALGSAFARHGRGSIFAAGLAAGVSVMFAGFLRTSSSTRREHFEVLEASGGTAVSGN